MKEKSLAISGKSLITPRTPVGEEGHAVFGKDMQAWMPLVKKFLRSYQIIPEKAVEVASTQE